MGFPLEQAPAAAVTATAGRTVLLTGQDANARRREIRDYFNHTFTLYERLYDCLADDSAFYKKAIPLRHPLIFYFGHTAVFFINKLHVAKLIPARLDPGLESMLAIGVDEMSWDDLDETHYDWPSVDRVRVYRKQVRRLVDDFIMKTPLSLPIGWDDPMWIVIMGIEHERIHLETTSVLLRQLRLPLVRSNPLFPDCPERGRQAPQNHLVAVAGREVRLGKSRHDRLYGWDNEYGELAVRVADFKASQLLVSNGEYLEFVEQGGYHRRRYWTDEGWSWVEYTQSRHPQFWIASGHDYSLRTMTREIAMPWDWPVEVNYLEAKAFCNWKTQQSGLRIRLPSEAEWYCLREAVEGDLPDWGRAPGNINLEYWASACPVDRFKSRLPDGTAIYDILGNVWQWTETPIEAYPGFQVHPVYDDFSTPTFDGKHNLIKGGSFFSTGNCAVKDSRYAFRRHFYQHAGFRYIESEDDVVAMSNPYEGDEQVSQYLEFHYGEECFGVPNFARACAGLCISLARAAGIQGAGGRALDLGCAVGRSTFELAKYFDEVDGLDFSARFIAAAAELQHTGLKRYVVREEGELLGYREIQLKQFDLADVADRCQFMQADACNLPGKFRDYDLVFAGNLIDRLYSPRKFLCMIHERMRPGALLIVASPYTWLEEFTARQEWLGGFKDDAGENFTSLDGLREALGGHFELLGEPRDVPLVIRETRRKFQHTLSQLTVWQLTA